MIKKHEEIDLFGDSTSIGSSINREQLADLLYETMHDFTIDQFVACLTNIYIESLEYMRLVNGERACQKTSLLFNPHRLDIKTKSSKRSLFAALSDRSFMSGLARVTLLNKERVKEILYQSMQLGVNGIQYVNEFPPHIARDFAYHFKLNSSSRVLDPCAGWGGRMIGLSVVVNSYTAYEPSTLTHSGLLKLLEFIKKAQPEFKANLFNSCYEDITLREDIFDFAITSPPYYDTEEYSDEETNSLNRYKTFDQWVQYFYLPMISKTIKAIKPGCTFALNIGSRMYPLNQLLRDNFGDDHEITVDGKKFSGNSSGLNKKGEGETFYFIKKS